MSAARPAETPGAPVQPRGGSPSTYAERITAVTDALFKGIPLPHNFNADGLPPGFVAIVRGRTPSPATMMLITPPDEE